MSNELKCTEGIWRVEESLQSIKIIADTPYSICTIKKEFRTHADSRANAHLIAASKDLYNALKEVLDWGKTKDGKFSFNTSEQRKNEIEAILQKANPSYKP